nr:hypothetical protein Iba_chr01dCG8860 [Ipomoea batatas]
MSDPQLSKEGGSSGPNPLPKNPSDKTQNNTKGKGKVSVKVSKAPWADIFRKSEETVDPSFNLSFCPPVNGTAVLEECEIWVPPKPWKFGLLGDVELNHQAIGFVMFRFPVRRKTDALVDFAAGSVLLRNIPVFLLTLQVLVRQLTKTNARNLSLSRVLGIGGAHGRLIIVKRVGFRIPSSRLKESCWKLGWKKDREPRISHEELMFLARRSDQTSLWSPECPPYFLLIFLWPTAGPVPTVWIGSPQASIGLEWSPINFCLFAFDKEITGLTDQSKESNGGEESDLWQNLYAIHQHDQHTLGLPAVGDFNIVKGPGEKIGMKGDAWKGCYLWERSSMSFVQSTLKGPKIPLKRLNREEFGHISEKAKLANEEFSQFVQSFDVLTGIRGRQTKNADS